VGEPGDKAVIERPAASETTPIDGRILKEQLERDALKTAGPREWPLIIEQPTASETTAIDGRILKEQLERDALKTAGPR
jgi:hypothetical protein